jgi:hypothetical protein
MAGGALMSNVGANRKPDRLFQRATTLASQSAALDCQLVVSMSEYSFEHLDHFIC